MVEAHHHHRTNEGRLTREHRSWSGCTAIDRNGCAKSPVRIFFHEEDSRLGGLWFGVPRTIETQRNCPGGVGRDTADLPCIVPASRMRGHRSVGQLRFPIASALASRSERSLCLARMEQRGQLSLPGDLSSTETPSPRVVIAHSARVCCTAVSEARSPEEEEKRPEGLTNSTRVNSDSCSCCINATSYGHIHLAMQTHANKHQASASLSLVSLFRVTVYLRQCLPRCCY